MLDFMLSKKLMIKLFLFGTAAILVCGLVVFQKNSSEAPQIYHMPATPNVHLAGDLSVSLKKVRAKVVYFVPNDLGIVTSSDRMDLLYKTMDQEKNFFNFALDSALNFNYDIFPDSVTGIHDHHFYDATSTNHGNFHALITAREEIQNRIFNTSGDLYSEKFSAIDQNEYNILIIIYGNTGASALVVKNAAAANSEDVIEVNDGLPAVLLSISFLTDPRYQQFGPTVLAHEIAHTLGLEDGYDLENGAILTEDLMGAGRRQILSQTYISDKNKNLLGL